jgi:phosphate transport system substrate-binding protein
VNDGSDCVKPSEATVRDGTYKPLSRPLMIYVNKKSLDRPEVAEFVKFYLANTARLSTEVGYVPVTDDVAADNDKLLKESLPKSAAAATN